MLVGLRCATMGGGGGLLPSGLTMVEYIKWTHTSQYSGVRFDSGYKLTGDIAKVKVELKGLMSYGYVYNNNVNGLWYVTSNISTSNNAIRVDAGVWSSAVTFSAEDGVLIVDGGKVTYNGNVISTLTTKSGVVAPTNMPLGCLYDQYKRGYIWYADNTDIIRDLKIYYNGELKVHLIPCVNQLGKGVLYDLVNQVTRENLGTGTIVAGPVL